MSPEPSRTARAVDVAVVLVLTTVALVGLDDSFATRAYLVTGLIGALATTAWALLCTVQRWSSGMFLLVASVAFPVLGATAALHDWEWLGLPSASSVADLLTALFTAPGEFLTTIPPVDAQGTVLAIPYVVGFLCAGAAARLALRTRRPVLPGLPLVLALVLCIALGTEQPPSLRLRAAAFAGLLLMWVALRAARRRVVEHPGRGRSARTVAAAVVAVVAVLGASTLVPRVPAGERTVLRGRVGAGHDVSRLDNPLAGFRTFTEQPSGTPDNVADKRLLRVTGLPRHDLLRIVTLDTYDGTLWKADNRTVPDDRSSLFQRIGQEVGAPRPGRRLRVGVEVRPAWTSSWLPLAGQLTGITFDFLDGRAQREDVRYDVATQTGMVVGGLQVGDDYHFSATVPDGDLSRSAVAYGDGLPAQPTGAFLDRYLRPWRQSGLTPVRQLFSLARYLRVNGRYSDGGTGSARRYLPGHSELRLGRNFFAAHSIVGDDEQYAAFTALAANRLGVPARVVVSAVPDRQGWVRGRDVRAGVEVRVADGSWRSLPTARFMSHRPPRRSDADPATPESFVRRTTPDEPQRSEPPQAGRTITRPPVAAEQQATAWWPWVIGCALLLLAAVPLAKWARRRRRRAARRTTARVVGGWAEVLAIVRDGGREVPHGLPRTEQARRLGLSLELARTADALVFAPRDPTTQEAADFWRAVSVERRRLAHELGGVRRVLAAWNPASLAGGRRPHHPRPTRRHRLGRAERSLSPGR